VANKLSRFKLREFNDFCRQTGLVWRVPERPWITLTCPDSTRYGKEDAPYHAHISLLQQAGSEISGLAWPSLGFCYAK